MERVLPREGCDVYSSRPLSVPALFGEGRLNVKGIIPESFRPETAHGVSSSWLLKIAPLTL